MVTVLTSAIFWWLCLPAANRLPLKQTETLAELSRAILNAPATGRHLEAFKAELRETGAVKIELQFRGEPPAVIEGETLKDPAAGKSRRRKPRLAKIKRV